MNGFTVVFVALMLASSTACDWHLVRVAGEKPRLLTGWLGAWGGGLLVCLGLNCVMLFAFMIDPWYVLVNELLIAGIAGAVVDLPLSLYRNVRAKQPWRRTATEAVVVVVTGVVLLVMLDWYRTTYPPNQLPI